MSVQIDPSRLLGLAALITSVARLIEALRLRRSTPVEQRAGSSRAHNSFDFAAHQSDAFLEQSRGAAGVDGPSRRPAGKRLSGADGGGSSTVLRSDAETTMPKLNDTQSVLLATAAQRHSGSIYPLPETITRGAPVTKATAGLLKAALVEERQTSDVPARYRADGDLQFGLFITPAGLQAIGVEPEDGEQPVDGADTSSPAPATAAPRQSKTSEVLTLLAREEGATLPELIEATGWLPHTTRAALTGLRKKGHTIEKTKRGEVTCYHVAAAGVA